MRIPQYWARSRTDWPGDPIGDGSLETLGWSDQSPADAQRVARERGERVAERIARGEEPDHYGYADRPIREPILDRLERNGQPLAVVTRNRYGAEVLNTSGAMFVDIDTPGASAESRGRKPGFFSWLGGSEKRRVAAEQAVAEAVSRAVERHGLTLRLYRTAGGYRGLVTNRTFEPGSETATSMLRDFGADPHYVRLCSVQRCFRARLTPKPWRMDIEPLDVAFPWRDEACEQAVRQWVLRYERASQGLAVCRVEGDFGGEAVHEDVAPVMRWHDERTCVDSNRLA